MVLQPGFAEALLAPFRDDDRVGQTQAKLLYLDDPGRINDGGGCQINFWMGRTDPVGFKEMDHGQCDSVAPCISCGGAMMVRVDLFQQLGGFDSIFDPFGPEDLDFSLRLQALGYKALYIPSAVAYHAVNHTFEGGEYTAVYARSKARHWLRFLRRHGTPVQKLGFALVGAPVIAMRMTAREVLRGNPGAVIGSVRGLFEALRGHGGSEKALIRARIGQAIITTGASSHNQHEGRAASPLPRQALFQQVSLAGEPSRGSTHAENHGPRGWPSIHVLGQYESRHWRFWGAGQPSP
jgi:hypothetical protein